MTKGGPGANAPGLRKSRRRRERVTIARALSKLGIASRAQARALIEAGRVGVNRTITRSPDYWVDLRQDRLSLDGRLLKPQRRVYFALHKPAGVVTTRSDERGRKTVYDLLPSLDTPVFAVGRLDKDSSGLLLLTNDTQFGEVVTSPLRGLRKEYHVITDRPLSPADRRTMTKGMTLPDGPRLKPAEILSVPGDGSEFRIIIQEGKNRQIRRMCEALGYEVLSLRRDSIGAIRLGALAEGKIRTLSEQERDSVLRDAGRRR